MSSHDPDEATVASVAPRPAILRPIERFLRVEAASGVVLLAAAIVALVWANSPFAEQYEHAWHVPVGLQLGDWSVSRSLHFVVNDMLMTVFFLVVGLEIRREMHDGALADLRLATLPIIAAIGGVMVPALIYVVLNTAETRNGWAVPTATDIAFAVGVLALLGKRVPASLRVLLLALAVIDDIIAILIIALFYSSGLQPLGLAISASGIALVIGFQRIGFRSAWVYVLPGSIVWIGVLYAHIHPTIAGVVLGLLTPVQRVAQRDHLADVAGRVITRFRDSGGAGVHSAVAPVRDLADIQREMLAPAERVQMALHPWVAFGIMPLFALANSGVPLGDLSFASLWRESVSLGVVLGLCVGKPLGITLASVLAIHLGLAKLPAGSSLRGVLLVGCLAGIGFTMAIFIANLAFATPELLAEAKLAILMASGISGMVGLALGRLLLKQA